MLCPYCKEPNTQVIDSRTCEEGSAIRRIGHLRWLRNIARFTTYEKAALQMPLIIKKNGSVREAYNSDKLRRSMQIALRKRLGKASELDSAISRIEKQLQVSGEKEVTSKRVGDMVMLELKKLDNVAYVRYGSVYFNCGTLDDMIKLVENAREDQGKEGK